MIELQPRYYTAVAYRLIFTVNKEGLINIASTENRGGGQPSTKVSNVSGPSCPGFVSTHSQMFSEEKIVNVAEVNQWDS